MAVNREALHRALTTTHGTLRSLSVLRVRLGSIVTGRITARPDEQARIAAVLRVPTADIFPPAQS